ncbi:MAG: sigma-70 family RNA polymerase sigma factor [Acidimicrobiia bacterium]|nr:sigma-70 family RNA polymerase sigma factor [Acidimicrobiia bacterium]
MLIARGRLRFDPRLGSLRAFLTGVIFNLHRQRRRREREAEDTEERESAPTQLEDMLSQERSALVQMAVQSLPEAQREVLILFHYEQLSIKEIALITGAEPVPDPDAGRGEGWQPFHHRRAELAFGDEEIDPGIRVILPQPRCRTIQAKVVEGLPTIRSPFG